MNYAQVGVNYSVMDLFKVACQEAARKLPSIDGELGVEMMESSLGESSPIVTIKSGLMTHVMEGLGTKNIIADICFPLFGKSFYGPIAQDAAAMILNDVVTSGALPITLTMYLAAGDSSWFENEVRWRDLIDGWFNACKTAGCLWVGGETPTLKGVISSETVDLAGSGTGYISPKMRLISEKGIKDGDVIILLESSGIHSNGSTLCRKIGEDTGYLSTLSDGRTFGEALLSPTIIYAPFIKSCIQYGIDLHYLVNITGHGYRKLMRPSTKFIYVLDDLFTPQAEFDFIQQKGQISDQEMYSNFNMGAGFAVYVSVDDVNQVMEISKSLGIRALVAGKIKESDVKKVILPNGIVFDEESLQIR